MNNMRKIFSALVLVMLLALLVGPWAFAAESEAQPETDASVGKGLLALGAGLAIGLGGLGTGIAQSRIGPASAGVIAEKPDLTGLMIVLLAIPETIVILGFVISAIILFMF